MGIGRRGQIDLGARDVQKAQRIAARERTRLVGADDVVGNRGNGSGRVGTGAARKGKNEGHETLDYMSGPHYARR